MALVPVPSDRLVLVDAPAASVHGPHVLFVRAGVRLPAGVRAVAAVNRRQGSVIAQATTGGYGSAQLMVGLGRVLIGGSTYTAARTVSTPRLGKAIAQVTTRTFVSGLITAGLGPVLISGPSYVAASASTTRGHGSPFFAMALGEGTGSGGHDVGYYGYADAESKNHAAQVDKMLRIRARLAVMIDQVALTAGPELRAVLIELNELDPVAPIYHWVVPRLESRLRQVLGEDVYIGVFGWNGQLDRFDLTQKLLINGGSGITGWIKSLTAQIMYTVMHTDASKAALPFDNVIYDITPTFLKTISDIAGKLHVNIDLLSFTDRPPVTLQQIAANHAKGLLHTFEAVVNYRGAVNPELPADSRKVLPLIYECDPSVLMKELKQHYNMLLAEEYRMVDYLTGPRERHTGAVQASLAKLEKDLRPLRLRD